MGSQSGSPKSEQKAFVCTAFWLHWPSLCVCVNQRLTYGIVSYVTLRMRSTGRCCLVKGAQSDSLEFLSFFLKIDLLGKYTRLIIMM